LPSPRPVDGTLRYDEGLFVGHRGHDRDGREPRFRFGSGLGYTTWEYLSADGSAAAVTVRLRNTGSRRGREVVQVYAARPDGAVERPVRWLAGFAVGEADPAEEVAVTVELPERTYRHWDEAGHRWATEAGRFRLHVGPSSGVLPLALDVHVRD
jgi:beta-glucosidase